MNQMNEAARIMRLTEVVRLTGLCKSSIYLLIKRNQFPSGVKIGKLASGWSSVSVQSWIESRLSNNQH